MTLVTIYGRTGCHLCEDALKLLQSMQDELNFEIEEILIDGNEELEKLYVRKFLLHKLMASTMISGE